MKQAYIIVLGFCLMLTAGEGYGQKRRDKVEAFRVAYITRHVAFSVSEAERFWPVYNEYNDKLRALKKTFRESYAQYSETMSEEKVQELYSAELRLRQAEHDVHRMYSERIRNIIGYRKYMRLRVAEEGFRREMINTIREGGD